MATKFDVLVVGAGPAGLVAARAAGESGFRVALVERKSDPAMMDRACGQTLDSANEYLHHDLYICNLRDKRLCFPAHGFSVKYDGPYRNAYSWLCYSPNGTRIQAGVIEEQREKGDHGKVTAICDLEILLRCLLEEAREYGVEVFPGTKVESVITTRKGVKVEGSGRSFEGKYLIAADGVNSLIAERMGFNKHRAYLCRFRALSYYMSGVELPEPDGLLMVFGFVKEGPAMMFVHAPRHPEGQDYNLIVLTIHPRVDLKSAADYFMKEAFCASWFKKAKILRRFPASQNCWTPIAESYRDRVFLAGDVGSTQELEITGAMICGWKAGHAASVALQEENLGLEITATSNYVNWWKRDYITYYDQDAYMKTWGLPYILSKPEEIDYLFSLIKEPMPPCFNPYTMQEHLGKALAKVMPGIGKERPEMVRKLERMSLPFTEIISEIANMSKPLKHRTPKGGSND
jgi:digeranylgeranylglycerophospholipid reductase